MAKKGRKKGPKLFPFAPLLVPGEWYKAFVFNGGDDETRTRDLCRDASCFKFTNLQCIVSIFKP